MMRKLVKLVAQTKKWPSFLSDKKCENLYKFRFPETYRGQSSTYNQSLGRYQTSYDSPGFRYYRFKNGTWHPMIKWYVKKAMKGHYIISYSMVFLKKTNSLFRYDNHQEGPRISHSRVNQHMPRFRCFK